MPVKSLPRGSITGGRWWPAILPIAGPAGAGAAREETDHLAWCRHRLHELRRSPRPAGPARVCGLVRHRCRRGSCRRPVAVWASWPKTERQVERHLDTPSRAAAAEADTRSRAILAQMRSRRAGPWRAGPQGGRRGSATGQCSPCMQAHRKGHDHARRAGYSAMRGHGEHGCLHSALCNTKTGMEREYGLRPQRLRSSEKNDGRQHQAAERHTGDQPVPELLPHPHCLFEDGHHPRR